MKKEPEIVKSARLETRQQQSVDSWGQVKTTMTLRTIISLLLCLLISLPSLGQNEKKEENKIQIAFLLDVSGSMNGLINQAKGQMWRMVNEISKAEKNGQKVRIEIALGSYGNSTFQENGYFHLNAPLTMDIDLISEQLFNLTTGGSEEYCGYAIQTALDSLEWSDNKEDLKIIFIAGNETFALGEVDYSKVCKQATKKRIIINTIYCGTEQEGIDNLWADGAKKGKGKYMTINQDSALKLTETFWDKRIIDYNRKLNGTYVPYGTEGEKFMQRQIRQDENALLLGNVYLRDRVIFKISNNYQNAHWDLVDAYRQDSSIIEKLDPAYFPENMKTMTKEGRMKFLQQKQMERDLYKEGALVYSEKAKEFLEASKGDTNLTLTLDNSIIDTITEQGQANNFVFK